jgi:hypothetical protein
MTVTCDLVLETDVIKAVQSAAANSPRAVNTLINKSIRGDVEWRILPRLRQQPGEPVEPIQWATELQRIAFFASDGFGRGIGADRTGQLAQSWRLNWDIARGIASVENTAPYAKYVYYPRQQPFHRNTGWMGRREIEDIVLEESERASDAIVEGWFSIEEFEGALP